MKFLLRINLLLVITFFIVGCEPATPSAISTQTESQVLSPTVFPSADAPLPTHTKTLTPTATLTLTPPIPLGSDELAKTQVADINYLNECKGLNPIKSQEQIPYQNILPGKTRESELDAVFGTPDESYTKNNLKNLVFDNVIVLVEDNVVRHLIVTMEQKDSQTLAEIILWLGCPDIIFAINTMEEPTGGYNATQFSYYRLGIEFRFLNFPVRLTDMPGSISYFVPGSLDKFLHNNNWDLLDLAWGRPVEWYEAVK